jgi:hypothetical protein
LTFQRVRRRIWASEGACVGTLFADGAGESIRRSLCVPPTALLLPSRCAPPPRLALLPLLHHRHATANVCATTAASALLQSRCRRALCTTATLQREKSDSSIN